MKKNADGKIKPKRLKPLAGEQHILAVCVSEPAGGLLLKGGELWQHRHDAKNANGDI